MDPSLPAPEDSPKRDLSASSVSREAQWWWGIYPEFSRGEVVSACGDEVLYRGHFGAEQHPCLLLPLRAESFPSAEELANFAARMAVVQQVAHPALLKIFGIGIRDGTACICYEDCAGEPLTQIFPKRPRAHFSVSVIAAVASGLHAAHTCGILHGDVNSAWILVTAEGAAKLVGLGIAPLIYPTKRSFYEASLRRPAVLRAYVAPEQLKEESAAPVSARTDIYSLGALSYHLLTGVPLGGYVVLPSSGKEVGTFTDDVVFTATLADPHARQVSAEIFADQISRIGGGVDNSHFEIADAEAKARQLQAHHERVRNRNLVLAAVGLAAVTATAVFLWKRPQETLAIADGDGAVAPTTTRVFQPERLRNLISKERREEAMAVISSVMQGLVAKHWTRENTEELEEISYSAIQLGQTDAVITHTNKLLLELPPDCPDLERVGRLVGILTTGKQHHETALGAARKFRAAGQKERAREELAKAQAYLPDHPDTLAEYKLLDFNYLPVLQATLAQVRLHGGAPLQFGLHERGLEMHVDLANNPTLTEVSFLKGQAVTHLDVSNTAVTDLQDVALLPLQVLHVDYTGVQDLRPLRGSSLRLLTAEGNEVVQKGAVFESIFLTNCRIGLPYKKSFVKTDRAQRNQAWINHLGMRFAPMQGSSSVLFGDWETRIEDFKAFAEATRLPTTPGMTALDQDGTWKTMPNAWSTPPGPQTLEDPVVGVNFTEANQFCEWLTKTALAKEHIPRSAKFRLPTSQEWTQATGLLPAQGGQEPGAAVYPWGSQWPPPETAGNYPNLTPDEHKPALPRKYAFTSPVGLFRNLCPHRDMGGNVREWCRNEAQQPVVRDASCLADTRAFPQLQDALKITAETALPADTRDATVGFRVVLDFGQAE